MTDYITYCVDDIDIKIDGYTFDEYIKYFDQLNLADDTVGNGTTNIYDINVRNSKSAGIKLTDHDELVSLDNLTDIYSSKYMNNDEMKKIIINMNSKLEFRLHCYTVDGKFAPHTDGKKNVGHFATLLIFPPATYSPFTGGDLVFYPDNGKTIVMKPSKFTDWTAVVFKIDLEHEVRSVVSGKRYVFKTQLCLPKTNLYFMNENIVPSVNIKNPAKYFKNEINILQEKIDKYNNKISALKTNKPTDKILHTLNRISESDKNAAIILPVYPETDPSCLEGEYLLLWNAIIAKYPCSQIVVHKISQCVNAEYCDAGHIYLSSEDEFGGADIIYWKNKNKHEYGDFIKSKSTYNDNTYNTWNKRMVSIICVQK